MPTDRHLSNLPAPTKRKVDTRIELDAAINFARGLYRVLSSRPSDAPATDTLANESKSHAENIHTISKYVPGVSGDPELDKLATGLWNICNRLRRELAGPPENGNETGRVRLLRLFLRGRVLAFFLLTVSRARKKDKGPRVAEVFYLLKLALKTGRGCIDGKELELAVPVFQKATDYKGALQDLIPHLSQAEIDEENCLEAEYFILRTALSWMENKLDVADFMYTKGELLKRFLTPQYAERLADILFEISKSFGEKSKFPDALLWLGRASDIINDQDRENLSREGAELRLAILQALVTAHLNTGTAESLESARKYVDSIEAEIGRKPVVSLMRLELLQKTPAEVFDSDSYGEILRRMVRDFRYSEPGFKLIIHHIRRLHDKSPAVGGVVLDDFIIILARGENDLWMEKAVLTRMWMITNQRDTLDTIDAVQNVLAKVSRPLSPDAAVAAQALIWKKLESSYARGDWDMAESWCRLSLEPIFRSCGAGNTAKLERKLLLCALSRNNLDGAASLIERMSPQSWQDPMTAYLGFKAAIRMEDRELAEKCIEVVASAPNHVDYLGACVAESQQAQDVLCAFAALKKLQAKLEYNKPSEVHIPALFRCTIRLLNFVLDRPDAERNRIIDALCAEFEAVASALEYESQHPKTPKLFTTAELEWFGRNSYNLALKNTTSWDLRCVVRMLTSCVTIIGYFPHDFGPQADLLLKCLFARFISSSALVSLARTEDNLEKRQNDYMAMRRHIQAFDSIVAEQLSDVDQATKDDLERKHAVLLAFDFEGALVLEQWDDLSVIVQKATALRNITAYQAMADSLLRGRPPGQVLYSTMRKIINESWMLESFDAVRLAKYTRCLFQATLPVDDDLGMKLLDEASSKARELREGDAAWPEEELEWMATTAFNHAIDCYGLQQKERAREWATKAINLSHYCGDDGGLERALQERYIQLSFDKPLG